MWNTIKSNEKNVTSRFLSGKISLIRTLIFLTLLLFSTKNYSQNFDFEEWTLNNNSSSGGQKTDSIPKHWTAGWSFEEKSTDAYSGYYSLRLHRWYTSVIGRAILGSYHSTTDRDFISSGMPVSGKPTKLKGSYKYINVIPGDSAEIIVMLKKWNTTTNKVDTVAYGRTLLDSTNVYSSFYLNIQELISSVQPDSIVIAFFSSHSSTEECPACDYLYIDSLSLEGGSIVLSSNNIEKKKVNVNVFPNPFSESTSVEITNWESINKNIYFTLYNVLGEKVKSFAVQTPTFNLQKENLQCGVYFYQINNDSQLIANGKIVVE